jgi:hypothetical protein
MNRRLVRIALAAGLSLVGAGSLASTAFASFHLNRIREVHEGGATGGDYVELQAMSAGENLVAGKHIVTYDAGGGELTDYTIPSNVANGADQATILVANAATVGGVTPDFQAGNMGTGDGNLNVDNTGGTVCYTDSSITSALDCVAFDHAADPNPFMTPTFNPPQFGAPFILPGADLDGQSLIRSISRGCATTLDSADDTNSAADFTLGTGTPRNNATAPTETPCPTPPASGKKKCKKKKKHKRSAEVAKKHKKCKKKKKKH